MAIRYLDGEQKEEPKAAASGKIRYLDDKPIVEVGAGRTALEQGLQGATFGFSDEIMDRIGAGIASIFTDESYGNLLEEARGMSQERMKQQFEQRPGLSIASNIGGALLTGGALAAPKTLSGVAAQTGARGALNVIPKAGEAVMRGVRSGGTGARLLKGGVAGATSGALYGAGTAQEGERLGGATTGGAVGGVVSVLAPVAIGTVKKGYDGIAGEMTRRLATKSGELRPVDKAIAKVVDRLRADFPDDKEFVTQLHRYASSQGKSLVESGGKATTNLAEGASLFPGGQKIAAEFFDAKIDMAPEQVKKVLSRTISPSVNYLDTLDDVVRVGQAKASPLYKKAFKANQQVESPLVNRILRTPAGAKAFIEARKNIQNEMSLVSKPDKELTAIAKDLDLVTTGKGIGKGLKLRTLDYVKRSMDRSINAEIKKGESLDTGELGRLVNIKKSLVSELDRLDKTGTYAKARATAGDYLQSKAAMDRGLDFLREDPEQLARSFTAFTEAERRAYKVGVLKTLNNQIDNTFDGRNVARVFGKKSTRDKLQTILTPKQFELLKTNTEAADQIYKLRNQLTGNSRTAIRQVAAEEFANEGAEVMTSIATRGVRSVAMEKFVNAIARKFSGLSDKAATDVAEILYETDPKIKARIVRDLFSQYKGTTGLRQTQAAQRLEAFYAISDKIKAIQEATQNAAPAIGAGAGMMTGGF